MTQRNRPANMPTFCKEVEGPDKTPARSRPAASTIGFSSRIGSLGLIRSLTCGPLPVQIRLVETPAEYSRRQTAGLRPHDDPPPPMVKRCDGPEPKRSDDTRSASTPRR